MNQKEKLIELLDQNCGYVEEQLAENLADHLIANGVVMLPCRCCECKYSIGKSFIDGKTLCILLEAAFNPDDFCSYGKRKGGDE